ncbi:F-box associated domain-containing protein [Caenorhabditis elegans]|uniref:F-box associated domain-containing protein n=1 Tax=Caenorhabditis elegans TaxID=6239 RepID=O45224_CAEEL|nr:F-box associated domain-containing protein [Caenorhabditis elegans]CAB03811.2 F-box associated domain-containing protein [Caenorhabditis elegans]|eukprot:NP_507586.2 F-box B protein [Caenorhabditis elegans]
MGTLSPSPTEPQLHTLDMFDLISRSFCSETIKNQLKSLNVRNAEIRIILPQHPEIHISVGSMSAVLERSAANVRIIDRSRENSDEKTFDITSGCLNFTERDYLLHFEDVIINPRINVSCHTWDERFNAENLLNGFIIQELDCQFHTWNKDLQTALNNARSLKFFVLFSSYSTHHQAFSMNFERLSVTFWSDNLNLNTLLISSSPIIEILGRDIKENDINLFIKHWMLGILNYNLKYLNIVKVNQNLNEEAIRMGIRCEQKPKTLKRIFKFKDRYLRTKNVYGGYDIQRNDGVRATISHSLGNFHFMVWD